MRPYPRGHLDTQAEDHMGQIPVSACTPPPGPPALQPTPPIPPSPCSVPAEAQTGGPSGDSSGWNVGVLTSLLLKPFNSLPLHDEWARPSNETPRLCDRAEPLSAPHHSARVIISVQNMSSAPLPGNWFHMQTLGD